MLVEVKNKEGLERRGIPITVFPQGVKMWDIFPLKLSSYGRNGNCNRRSEK